MNDWPTLHPGTAHVWLIDLQPPLELIDGCQGQSLGRAILSDDEYSKATRFVTDALTQRYAAAHVAQRVILGQYLAIDPQQVPLTVETWGRPVLDCRSMPPKPGNDGFDGLAPLHFNLSHSGALAMLAVTGGHPVGMDVERIREAKMSDGVSRKVFTPTQCDRLRTAPPDQQQQDWFRYWTAKESVMKAVGKGFYLDPLQIDLNAEVTQAIAHEQSGDQSFFLYRCRVPSGWVATVASPQSLESIDQHRFDWKRLTH